MEHEDTGVSDDDVSAEAFVEDGDSTDAESENSNDALNAHHFTADLNAELEELKNRRADLDHLDSMGIFASAKNETKWTRTTRLQRFCLRPSWRKIAVMRGRCRG